MNFDLAAELADAAGIEVRTVLARRRRRLRAARAGATAGAGSRASSCSTRSPARRPRPRRVARRGRGGHDAGGRRAADHGRRPLAVHDPGGRRADVRAARRPDGDRDGHPRRAGRPSRRRSSRPTGSPTSWSTRSSPTCDWPAGSRVAVLVNGLGATPKEELYILYRRVAARLAERRTCGPPRLGRRVRDVARDGRRVGQPDGGRRRAGGPARRIRSRRPFVVQA